MTTSIAEYFTNEIDNWKQNLDFKIEEIDELREWLEETLRLNTVPGLAGKVEHGLNRLMIGRQNMTDLYSKLKDHEKTIIKEGAPLNNKYITGEIKSYQQQLRTEMHEVEKAHTEIKYYCDSFLADVIIAQNSKNENNSIHNN